MTRESGTPVPDVDGVILTAPAVWGRATMDLLPRLALWAAARQFHRETVLFREAQASGRTWSLFGRK